MINQAALLKILIPVAISTFEKLANDQNLQRNIFDWIQIQTGNVSKRNLEEAIQLALNTSAVEDEDTICRIIAVITTLYATYNVNRGAIVGGTLLQEFGSKVFPHIHPRELRYAKKISPVFYKKVLKSIQNSSQYIEYSTK